MLSLELQRLEGVWTGTEQISDGAQHYTSSGRLVFQTVFDGRFLLCDYMQTAHERPTSFSHGVFRHDEQSKTLAVTWFRSPAPVGTQQASGKAEGDRPIFYETVDGSTTRTSFVVVMDRLSVCTDRAAGADWKRIFEGSYRRR